MSSPGRLDARVALVTGGSRGIGAAVSEWLVAHGADVYSLFRHNEHAAQALKTRLGEAGERLHLVKADVTEDAALTEAFYHGRQAKSAAELWMNYSPMLRKTLKGH